MTDSIFIPAGDGRYEPTEHARGPWDPRALHGGAPAALIARAFERMEPGEREAAVRVARRVSALSGDAAALSATGPLPL